MLTGSCWQLIFSALASSPSSPSPSFSPSSPQAHVEWGLLSLLLFFAPSSFLANCQPLSLLTPRVGGVRGNTPIADASPRAARVGGGYKGVWRERGWRWKKKRERLRVILSFPEANGEEIVVCFKGSRRSSLICHPVPRIMTHDCNFFLFFSSKLRLIVAGGLSDHPGGRKVVVVGGGRWGLGGWGGVSQGGFLDLSGIWKLEKFSPPFTCLQENFQKKVTFLQQVDGISRREDGGGLLAPCVGKLSLLYSFVLNPSYFR